MRINIKEIYRIETLNSVYEIKVVDKDGQIASVCKRMGKDGEGRQVQVMGTEYLERLVIGASFDVPGVVLTSVVQDYSHFVLSSALKRGMNDARTHVIVTGERHDGTPFNPSDTGIPGFFKGLAEHVKEQVNPQAVMVAPDPRERVEGCSQCESGPVWHNGSKGCKSGSIASGGSRAHCTCDYCY
jgi:hypothetical protein